MRDSSGKADEGSSLADFNEVLIVESGPKWITRLVREVRSVQENIRFYPLGNKNERNKVTSEMYHKEKQTEVCDVEKALWSHVTNNGKPEDETLGEWFWSWAGYGMIYRHASRTGVRTKEVTRVEWFRS